MSHKNKRLFEKAHESPNRQVGGFARSRPTLFVGWMEASPTSRLGFSRSLVSQGNGKEPLLTTSVKPSSMSRHGAVLLVGFCFQNRLDLADCQLELFVLRVEVRRHSNPCARAIVNEEIAAQKLRRHLLSERDVDNHGPAAIGGNPGTVDLEARLFG